MSDIEKKVKKLKNRINDIDENCEESFNGVDRHFNDIERRLRALESAKQTTATAAPQQTSSQPTQNSKRVIGIGFGLVPIYEGQNPKTDYPGFYPEELTQSSFTEKVIAAFVAMGMTREAAEAHVTKFIKSQDPRNADNGDDNSNDDDDNSDEESACDSCNDTDCPSHPSNN